MKEFALKYFNVLRGTLVNLNLTAIRSFPEFFQKQILDSVLPLDQSEIFNKCLNESKLLVDIGPGGGFPLLPLAFRRQDVSFLGIEARKKKVKAIEELKKILDLDFVKVHHFRVEKIVFDKKCIITFKAVGTCKECLDKILVSPQLTENIFVFFYKGPQLEDIEGKDLQNGFLNWELIEKKFMNLEGTDGRWLVGFKYHPPKKVIGTPHLHRPNKELVNLSDFL